MREKLNAEKEAHGAHGSRTRRNGLLGRGNNQYKDSKIRTSLT